MSFGNARLTSSDIAPATLENYARQRTLTPEQESGLWAAFGVAIALPFAWVSHENVSAVAIWTIATSVLALAAGQLLVPTAVRYGVGTGILARAAFGTDTSSVIHIVRYGVVTLWAADIVKSLSHWLALYVQALAPTAAASLDLEWTASARLVEVVTCIALGLIAGVIARGRVRRSRKTIRFFMFLAFVAVLALIVLGVWRVPLTMDAVLGKPLALADAFDQWLPRLLVIPVLAFTVPEWVRYRGEHLQRGIFSRLPRVLVNALVVALLASLVTIASRVVRHRVDYALVGDSSGAFGLVLGGVALALVLLLTLSVVPLFGVLNASSALCTTVPQLRYPWVARATGVLVGAVAAIGVTPTWTLVFLAPPLCILLVDAWVVRRNTVVLDALYEPGNVRPAGIIACLVGWLMIAVLNQTGLACVVASIIAAVPLLLRKPEKPAAPREEPAPPAEDWTEQPKLTEAEWSPDADTKVE